MGWNDDNLTKVFGSNLPEVTFTVEMTLTAEEMDDIFTTALESGIEGIGYWAVLDNTTEAWKKARRQIDESGAEAYYGTILTKVLLNGDEVRFYDAEADEDDLQEDEIWFLGMKQFLNGCKLYEENRGSLLKNLEEGNFDAVEADCLVQYAVFGEVIFG